MSFLGRIFNFQKKGIEKNIINKKNAQNTSDELVDSTIKDKKNVQNTRKELVDPMIKDKKRALLLKYITTVRDIYSTRSPQYMEAIDYDFQENISYDQLLEKWSDNTRTLRNRDRLYWVLMQEDKGDGALNRHRNNVAEEHLKSYLR